MMGYIEKLLITNEKISYRARIHWFTFIFPATFLSIGLFGAIADVGTTLHVIGYVFTALGTLGILNRYIERISTEFVVTNNRIILKTGLICREITELQLSKAEAMGFSESLCGRIFGFGSLTITTGGASTAYPLIANPLEFRKAINKELIANKDLNQ